MLNPFLDRILEIRWSQLTADKVGPAIEAALAGAVAGIARIAAMEEGSADYQNTFLALENATDLLNEAWAKVTHLSTVADSPALREAHNAMLAKVSAFQAGIPLNAALWRRLKSAATQPSAGKLSPDHQRFLEETMADFRQQGADLPPERKGRLEALQMELARSTQKYSENVLDATNAWELLVTDAGRLRGLPEHAKAAARESARKKGHGDDTHPVWRFTLQAPSMEPVMLYAEDVELRRQVWTAAVAVGTQSPHCNAELVRQILALRHEKATLLGQPHFADMVLARRMAGSGGRATEFITDLHRRVQGAFRRECRELEEFKTETTQTKGSALTPWEVAFWAEKLRQARYNFDEEELRPYFPLPGVIAGMFEVVQRLFGLRVTEQPAGAVETWHPEVKYIPSWIGPGEPSVLSTPIGIRAKPSGAERG